MSTDTNIIDMAHNDIGHKLGLHELGDEERNMFLESVGELVIESATLRYMAGLSPEQREVFELWLDSHENDENLLEEALKTYAEFADIVTEEMNAFTAESLRLIDSH